MINPSIWYVDGNLKTTGATTFSGFGVFIVKGNVEIEHDMTSTDGNPDETRVGLYSNGSVLLKKSNLSVQAQLFANGMILLEENSTLYGTATSIGVIEFKGGSMIYYRPATSALTEPFWPTSSQ